MSAGLFGRLQNDWMPGQAAGLSMADISTCPIRYVN